MKNTVTPESRWLLALESSTAHGGAALLRDGEAVETILLEEGLRHGRELLAAGGELLRRHDLPAGGLHGVAVSSGPGSYTGLRVGVMAAKALAYGAGIRLVALSSLAALAATRLLAGEAKDGDLIMVLQNARRDEVYAGLYRVEEGIVLAQAEDAAITPEEAALRLARLQEKGLRPIPAGSGFATYAAVTGGLDGGAGGIDPAAVGLLGWRQILREDFSDPFQLQPVYLRRDAESDWRHDQLIVGT